MKRIVLLMLMLLPLCAVAQKEDIRESKVPEVVLKNFTSKYPKAQDREWKVKNDEYEVDFMIDDKKYEAKYEADGRWKKTSINMSKRDVPEVVMKAVKTTQFAKWMVDDAELVQTPEYATLYLVKLVKGFKIMELLYTPQGELLKAKEKK